MKGLEFKAYRERLVARLAQWEAKADQLFAEARASAADRRLAVYQETEALKHRLATLRNQIAQVREGAAASAAPFSDEMEHAWDSVHDSWEVLKNRLHQRPERTAVASSTPS